jgi:hypothetical protein
MVAAGIISIAVDRRVKGEPYQDTNAAIHGVMMEIKQEIMVFMRHTNDLATTYTGI